MREIENSFGNKDLALPGETTSQEGEAVSEPIQEKEEKRTLPSETYALDIETEAITKGAYNKLKVHSVQLDNRFYSLDKDNREQLKTLLKENNLIAFNSSYEQIHLAREGFNV